jgi:hypothetical protein
MLWTLAEHRSLVDRITFIAWIALSGSDVIDMRPGAIWRGSATALGERQTTTNTTSSPGTRINREQTDENDLE